MKILKYFFLSLILACSSQYKLKIIAHRGASAYLPEHTLEAQAMAHAFNPDYIEPDLVLTKDDQLIILHDVKLESTTDVANKFPSRKRKDGHFYAVDFNLAEIKTLLVSDRFDPEKKQQVYPNRFPLFFSNFQIPTFQESIELIRGLNKSRGKNIGLYPEIKEERFHHENGKDIVKIFVEVLKKNNLWEEKSNIIIQSFDSRVLKRLRQEFNCKLSMTQLIADNSWKETDLDYSKMLTTEGLTEIKSYAQNIGPWIPMILADKNLVPQAHQLGLKIHPYTARKDALPPGIKDFQELVKILEQLKIDGVFTDFPDFYN